MYVHSKAPARIGRRLNLLIKLLVDRALGRSERVVKQPGDRHWTYTTRNRCYCLGNLFGFIEGNVPD